MASSHFSSVGVILNRGSNDLPLYSSSTVPYVISVRAHALWYI
jgi:hypothetical protein